MFLIQMIRYHIREEEANPFADFLQPILDYYPYKRATAQQCLRHKWLKILPRLDFKYSEEQIQQRFIMKKNPLENIDFKSEDPETEIFDCDQEDNEEEYTELDDELSFDEHDNYGYSTILNKSFGKTGFIPYGGGIRVEELDQDPNWQFIDSDKL